MLNRLILLLVVTLSSFLTLPLFSQITNVNVELDSLSTTVSPDSASYGSVFDYSIMIRNLDSVAVAAPVLYIMVKAGNNPPFILDSISGFQLGPSLTLVRQKADTITQQRYSPGINILVIWPDLPANYVNANTDSIRKNVEVIGSASTKDFPNESRLQFFPNPANSVIYFKGSGPNFRMKEIRLIDLQGKEIRTETGFQESVDISSLLPGTYLLQITFEDGKRQTGKMLIQ